MSIREELAEKFGDTLSESRLEAWEATKAGFQPGDLLEGEVVLLPHFGVFLDVGVGFPALISIIQFKVNGARPPLGSRVRVALLGFDDNQKQLRMDAP